MEELDFQKEASNLLRVRQGLSQKFPEVARDFSIAGFFGYSLVSSNAACCKIRLFIADFSSETLIPSGFPIATFDYQRVIPGQIH